MAAGCCQRRFNPWQSDSGPAWMLSLAERWWASMWSLASNRRPLASLSRRCAAPSDHGASGKGSLASWAWPVWCGPVQTLRLADTVASRGTSSMATPSAAMTMGRPAQPIQLTDETSGDGVAVG